jgi:hypothetical protein
MVIIIMLTSFLIFRKHDGLIASVISCRTMTWFVVVEVQ